MNIYLVQLHIVDELDSIRDWIVKAVSRDDAETRVLQQFPTILDAFDPETNQNLAYTHLSCRELEFNENVCELHFV